MKPTLYLGKPDKKEIKDIINYFPPTEFNSIKRSTIPLLEYWYNPEEQIKSMFRSIQIPYSGNAEICFEYPVDSVFAKDTPSYTDVMIFSKEHAIGIEAKYTEPEYQMVKEWRKMKNYKRDDVIRHWVNIINDYCSTNIDIKDSESLPYQMLHRFSSVLFTAKKYKKGNAILIYQYFLDKEETDRSNYYRSKLQVLSDIFSKSQNKTYKIYLLIVPTEKIIKTECVSKSSEFSTILKKNLMNRKGFYTYGDGEMQLIFQE